MLISQNQYRVAIICSLFTKSLLVMQVNANLYMLCAVQYWEYDIFRTTSYPCYVLPNANLFEVRRGSWVTFIFSCPVYFLMWFMLLLLSISDIINGTNFLNVSPLCSASVVTKEHLNFCVQWKAVSIKSSTNSSMDPVYILCCTYDLNTNIQCVLKYIHEWIQFMFFGALTISIETYSVY